MINPYIPLPADITIGDLYGPAMEITDEEQAKLYLEALIERDLQFGKTPEEAHAIELANLGYFAGYCSYETRERVQKLFGAVHPIFGSSKPTPEEAFNAGLKVTTLPAKAGSFSGYA